MLGKTAGGLLWLFRYMERIENAARLVDTGHRIALTRPDRADSEWASVLETAGARAGFDAWNEGEPLSGEAVTDWLLRQRGNPSSVLNAVDAARSNARLVRTAITREVWEAVNDCWMVLKEALARKVPTRNLPGVLKIIRQKSAYVRGTLHGTMLRNDYYDFARIGTFLERADATARLLDVKYYVLLPSAAGVGSNLDNAQWEVILRAASSEGGFRAVHGGDRGPTAIARFLMLDARMPRSLAFCYTKIGDNLGYLERDYGLTLPCHGLAADIRQRICGRDIESVFDEGLHQVLQTFLDDNVRLARQIEQDYRFYA
jgi:uncharacterized alpha-E superfamily protein